MSSEINTLPSYHAGAFAPQSLPFFQRQSKKVQIVIFNSLSSLATFFGQTTPSRKFSARALHAERDLRGVKGVKKIFNDNIVGEARNIAQDSIIRSNQDFKEAVKLLEQCKSLSDTYKKNISVDRNIDSSAKSKITGICAGINLDIAKKFLDGKDIPSIIKENAKGASAEAAANQAVYEILQYKLTKRLSSTIADLLVEKNPTDYQLKYLRDIEAFLWANKESMGKLKDSKSNLGKFFYNESQILNSEFFEFKSNKEGIEHIFIKDFDKFIKALNGTLSVELSEETTGLFKSILELQQAIKSEVIPDIPDSKNEVLHPNRWKKLIHLAGKIFGFSKPQPTTILSRITNEEHRFKFTQLFASTKSMTRIKTVAAARGLEIGSSIGCSLSKPNDQTFLNDTIGSLQPGIYGIHFNTESSAHAITLVINNDQSSYILDPNNVQLFAKDPNETIHLLERLLKLYPNPNKMPPHVQKGEKHHLVEIFQITKRST